MQNADRKTTTREQFFDLLNIFPALSDDERAYVEHARNRAWLTLQHLPRGDESKSILDVGSMRGLYGPAYMDLWKYGSVSLLGYDLPADDKLSYESQNGKTYTFRTAKCNIELAQWPFADNEFDTVVCMEVLEHLIFDPVFAMNEMARVLKPGGVALITVPNAASDECLTYAVNDMQPGFLRNYIRDALVGGERNLNTVYNLGHFHEYTRAELLALATSTGFAAEKVTGISPRPPLLHSFRFSVLRGLVHALFPRSQRIRENTILALLRKESYTPLDELRDRYPRPLYQPLSHDLAT